MTTRVRAAATQVIWVTMAMTAGCAPADATGLGFGVLLARSLGALVLVAGLAVVVLRLASRAGIGSPGPSRLEVLARSGIAPRTEVVALSVADRVVVVGLTPAGMHPLAEVPRHAWDASAAKPADAHASNGTMNDASFAARLDDASIGEAARRFAATGTMEPDDEILLDTPTNGAAESGGTA